MSKLFPVLNKMFTWLEENRPEAVEQLKPGLSDQQISEIEASYFPFRLPDPVRQIYTWRNGIDIPMPAEDIDLLNEWALISLESSAESYCSEDDPEDPYNPLYKLLVPLFSRNYDIEFLCLEVVNDQPGRLFLTDGEDPTAEPTELYPDLLNMIVVEGLEAGMIYVDDSGDLFWSSDPGSNFSDSDSSTQIIENLQAGTIYVDDAGDFHWSNSPPPDLSNSDSSGCIDSLPHIGSGSIDQTQISLSDQLQGISSPIEQQHFIEQFAESHAGDPETIPSLLAELQLERESINNPAIIRSLGKLNAHQPEVISALLTILAKGPRLSCLVVAETLHKIASGNQEAIHTLAQLADQTTDEKRRLYIAQALGGIGKGSEVARDALIRVIYNSSSSKTQHAAINALNQIDSGSQEAIEACLHIVQSGESSDARFAAMNHLGKIAIGNPLVIETFKAMIQTQGTDPWSQDSRTIGIRGLQEVNRTLLPIETIGNPVSIREGISWEETQKNFEEKAAHTSPENIDILLEFLANSTTEQDQQNAIVELTTLGKGKPKVIDRFLDLLPIHRQEKLDGLLVSGLFKIVTEDIPDDLKDKVAQVAVQELQLRDPEHPLKSLFGNIIGKIGRATPDMVESIARMVRTRESDWKSWLDSLVSMQPLGRQEVINLLNSSDDWQLLTSILSALERHGVGADDPAVVDGWIALTQRADPGIVSVGVFALERLGSGETRILEALERVVQSNDDEGVREMAVNALANLRSRGVN